MRILMSDCWTIACIHTLYMTSTDNHQKSRREYNKAMEKTASLYEAPGRSDVWNANKHYCHFRRKYITLMMTIIASTELILIQTMCSSKLRMDSIHSDKHIMDRILLIRRVMMGAPSLWEIICKWPALWCCRVINKSSYQNEKWNFKNERVPINLDHPCR